MSLRRRYILTLVAFALLLTAAMGWFSWRTAERALEEELDEKLLWVAGAAAEMHLGQNAPTLLAFLPGLEEEESQAYISTWSRLQGLLKYVDAAYVVRRDNSAIVTTFEPDSVPIGTQLYEFDLYSNELETAWETGEALTPLFLGEDGRYYKYGFHRLEDSDAMLIVLMQTDYLAPLSRLRNTILWGSVGAVLLAGLLAVGLATNIALPLERLSRAALRIQRGQWEKEVELEKGVELNRLSRAMERMRAGIVQRDEQLRLMLAQVAHEIRNPLGGLELFASIALETEDREDRIRLMERVRKEVEALNGIINDFLTFSRPLHPEIQLHDVRTSLQSAAEWVEHQVKAKGGDLYVTLPKDPLFVNADPDHVKRAVLNLLQNAGQAGTSVWLDAWVRRGEVVVAVRDDGPGVAPELTDRIFHPFVTDKEKGAGLGLAIVKRMIEANGARIVLIDPVRNPDPGAPLRPGGSGAEFRIYFQGSEHLPAGE